MYYNSTGALQMEMTRLNVFVLLNDYSSTGALYMKMALKGLD